MASMQPLIKRIEQLEARVAELVKTAEAMVKPPPRNEPKRPTGRPLASWMKPGPHNDDER